MIFFPENMLYLNTLLAFLNSFPPVLNPLSLCYSLAFPWTEPSLSACCILLRSFPQAHAQGRGVYEEKYTKQTRNIQNFNLSFLIFQLH